MTDREITAEMLEAAQRAHHTPSKTEDDEAMVERVARAVDDAVSSSGILVVVKSHREKAKLCAEITRAAIRAIKGEQP